MNISVLLSVVKIIVIIAYLFGLFWVMGLKVKPVTIGNKTVNLSLLVNVLGAAFGFGIIQLGLTSIGGFQLLNNFDRGLLYQACTMTMVALGLNLIYGFNGQFSLGQWGFYGIGAYAAADVTFRWTNGDSSGLIVLGVGVLLGGLSIWAIGKFTSNLRRMPVLSSFTLYLLGIIAAGFIAVLAGRYLGPILNPALGTNIAPGPLAKGIWMQVVYFLAVIFAGALRGRGKFSLWSSGSIPGF